MDIIYLHDLKIECVIGIWEWERRIKQTVILDLDMATDIRRAAATDHIDDTLNYKAVAKRIIQYVGDSQFQLVETMAEKVAEILLSEFKLKWARVRINTIGFFFESPDVGAFLWALARENDGSFVGMSRP